jgi:hypothetical protein
VRDLPIGSTASIGRSAPLRLGFRQRSIDHAIRSEDFREWPERQAEIATLQSRPVIRPLITPERHPPSSHAHTESPRLAVRRSG